MELSENLVKIVNKNNIFSTLKFKCLVLIELKNGMKPKEIKIKYGTSYPNISRIKKLYYEK